jgi:uncharacterized protein (UPF0548 family)
MSRVSPVRTKGHHAGVVERRRSSDVGSRVRALRDLAVNYEPVGATAGALPAGYNHICRALVLGTGSDRFERAAQQLMSWQMHRGAGLTAEPSASVAAEGVVVRLGLRIGPVRLVAPCRVVLVVDEPRRRGFAYGTLPGHPEQGEELFTVALEDDGRVVARVVAFSRPATWWAQLGAPVTSWVQRTIISRYLTALAG